MDKKNLLEWLDNFNRQTKIRRGIILSGNVIDLVFSENGNVITLPEVLEASLKVQGFQHVVFYNRADGISGISHNDWQQLTSQYASLEEVVDGEDYDMDDDTETGSVPAGQSEISPDDFFAAAQKIMLNETAPKTVFIIDWSNFLFGQINALSEQERSWLLRISNSLRNAKSIHTFDDIDAVQSVMVFLCQGSTVLPPAMYLSNPQFDEINIPLPSRNIRERAVVALLHIFQTKEPLSLGSRVLEDFVDLTDSLTIRDICNISRLSRQQSSPLSIDALVSLYKYGKKESPWEQLNREKLKTTVDTLNKRVKGQEQAIKAVNKVLIRAFTGLSGLQHSSKARTPKGALFFVGPTGVGKTELAKSLASFLFGDEDACLRFDMSEFNHEHADQRLIGAPPGYVGFEEGGQLTNAVKRRPFSLLLFDEIEKAHPRILDKFLQILEDGRLTDGKGETVAFSDTFIVFTSNIGASSIEPCEKSSDAFRSAVTKHFVEDLKRPEILGRIGEANIIPFNFMTDPDVLVAIARAKIEPLRNRLKEKWQVNDFIFEDEDKALSSIVKSIPPQNGGRGVLNALVTSLFDPLAEFLFDEIDDASELVNQKIRVIQAGNHFAFEIAQ